MEGKILILGATGKTGRLTLHNLASLGRNITIGGRDKSALAFLASEYDVPYIILDIKDKDKLVSIFTDFDIVINFIGPFSTFGYIPIEAAISAKAHYLDSSWEQEFISKLDSYGDSAIDNNVAVISGMGVSPGISDLMVFSGCDDFDECHSIFVYYVEGMRNIFSYGTLLSAAKALKSQSLFFSEGRFVPIVAGNISRAFTYANKFNHQRLRSYPSGDIVNIPRYIKTDSVECYFGSEAGTGLFFTLGRLPFSADSVLTRYICKCSAMLQYLNFLGNRGFSIAVEITGMAQGVKATKYYSLVSDDDPYVATSNLLSQGAMHLIDTTTMPVGVMSPGQAFGGAKLLKDSGYSISHYSGPPTQAVQ